MRRLFFLGLVALFTLQTTAQTPKELKKRAKAGDVKAMTELGRCYMEGIGVKQDPTTAMMWLANAINNGDCDAKFYRAVYQRDPLHFENNLIDAANCGSDTASFFLAEKYKYNDDIPSMRSALEYAANRGNSKAQYLLFQSYSKEDDDQSFEIAKQWAKKAIAQGYPGLQQELNEISQQKEAIKQEKLRMDKLYRSGQALPTLQWLTQNTMIINAERDQYSENWRKFKGLCSNDIFMYSGKGINDELDKALYLKSDEYKTELEKFKKDKEGLFAIVRNINDTELRFDASGFALFGNHTWDYIEGFIGTKIFYGTGADFYEWFYWPEKDILQATENNGLGTKHPYFNSNDINALADLKKCVNRGRMGDGTYLVILCKPGESRQKTLLLSVKQVVYVANPISLYIVDGATGRVVLDLSHHLGKLN